MYLTTVYIMTRYCDYYDIVILHELKIQHPEMTDSRDSLLKSKPFQSYY